MKHEDPKVKQETNIDEKSDVRTPYLDALIQYLKEDISPFDVPGHHMGNADNKLKDFVGKKAFQADVNAPIGLDNLANPKGVLKESMDLMAKACDAKQSFFLINGTSSGIIAMIMATCKPNEKIIIPRNVHKSVTNALILSGATPIYIMPKIDIQLEIAHQPTLEEYKRTIIKYPSAKAIFVINPTYFGAVINLEELVKFAHDHNTAVLVDEAHGAHYYFSEYGPKSAMRCGADVSSVSFHKTGGSLTQSSIILLNSEIVKASEIQKALNILNTTSPSTLLLASLDAARYYMEISGDEAMQRTYELARYAREEISRIPGFIPHSQEHFRSRGCYDMDPSKLVIEIDHIPLSGSEIYQMLKKDYHIQMELAETYVLLGILAIGTTKKHIDHLTRALKSISKKYYQAKYKYPEHEFDSTFPFMLIRPRTAYSAPALKLPLEEAEYAISKESIMIYPPGIPLVVPGEIITKDIIKKIQGYREKGNITILSEHNDGCVNVIDTNKWQRYEIYRPRIERYIKKKITAPRNDSYYLYNTDFKKYGLLLNWPGPISKNNRINEAFKRELNTLVHEISSRVSLSVACRGKLTKDVKALEEANLSIIPVSIKTFNASQSTPLVVQNENNRIRFISYNPTYRPASVDVKADTKTIKRIYSFAKYDIYVTDSYLPNRTSFILDGKKNCLVLDEPLTIEDSVIKLSQRELEENIKINFNIEHVTWLPNIPESLSERGYKLSDLINFICPNVVCVSYPKSKGVLSSYMDSVINKLKKENYEVVRFPIVRNVYPNKMECKAFSLSSDVALIQSYASFVHIHNQVFISNNGNEKYNREVERKLLKHLPNAKVTFLDTYYFNLMKTNLREFVVRIPTLIPNEE